MTRVILHLSSGHAIWPYHMGLPRCVPRTVYTHLCIEQCTGGAAHGVEGRLQEEIKLAGCILNPSPSPSRSMDAHLKSVNDSRTILTSSSGALYWWPSMRIRAWSCMPHACARVCVTNRSSTGQACNCHGVPLRFNMQHLTRTVLPSQQHSAWQTRMLSACMVLHRASTQ